MARLNGILTLFTGLLLALHAWASFAPSHYNWGFHHFSFYPTWLSASGLLLCGLFLVPAVRGAVLERLGALARGVDRLGPGPVFLLLLAGWVGLMLLLPAKLHLLGDSELILRLTPKLPSIEDVSANFRNQPLTYQALRFLQWVTGGGGAVEPITLYRIAGGMAGIVYLWIVVHLLRKLAAPPVEALLLGAFLLLRSGTQFFFGYVENYMFLYVALSAAVVTGWLALEGKSPRWLPAVLLATVPGFHIAGAVFLPALFFFLPGGEGAGRARRIIAVSVILAAGVAGALYLGPSWMVTRIADAFRHDLLPLVTPPGGVPYGILSADHLADWLNLNAHIAPFSLLIAVAGLFVVPRGELTGSPAFRFLAAASVIGLAATFLILPALGMARDWDMLSNFFIPLRFLSVFLLLRFLRAREFRPLLAMIVIVGFARWIGWLGINADEGRHLARAEALTVPALSGTFPKLYYEHLGRAFVGRKEYARAVTWYERYMEVDSLNPRILANLSDCYRALGDRDNIFRMLRLSVDAGSTNAGVFSNLAVEYIDRGDTARAVELLTEGLRHNPGHLETHANLSILAMERGDYRAGLRHAVDAMRLGMRSPVLLKNAGYASWFLGEDRAAVAYLGEYLKSAPTDAATHRVLEAAERRLARGAAR